MFDYDAELRRYHARLMEAAAVGVDDSVLDIGCGTGQVTRAAATAAARGNAVGIDIADPVIALARRLARQQRVANARFECGDAQVRPLPAERFSIAVSRFGTMFFADPRAAFANIATALRPGARLVQLVWQDSGRQEWSAVIRRALAGRECEPSAVAAEPAFSLADPARIRALLASAGFDQVHLTSVQEPVYYGPDAASALEAIRSLRMTTELLDDLDDASAQLALDRLQTVLEARNRDGVWFDSAAWLVTAHRQS